MSGFPVGVGIVPELHPDVWRESGKIQMTNLTMLNNISFMKYALKSIPGLANFGVPHGSGDGPRIPPRYIERVWKKFQMTNLTMPNNVSSMKWGWP